MGLARFVLSGVLLLVGVVVYDVVRLLWLRHGRPGSRPPLDHDALVGDGVGPPLRLAVLGDSAAAGYGLDDPDLAYPRQVARQLAVREQRSVELISRAANGARIADLAFGQLTDLPPEVDVVILAAGVNDALARRNPAEVERDMRRLIEAVRERVARVDIVVVGCPDLHTAPGFPWPVNQVIGWQCRRVCAAQERASVCQPVRFVRYPQPPTRDMYGADGFHPGPRGQAQAAAVTVLAVRGG